MNILRAGVILMVYLFVIITIYIFLSSPVDDIMSTFEDINLTASDSHIESNAGIGRTVFDMIFAVLGLVPVVWFVFWCFSREPDWRMR